VNEIDDAAKLTEAGAKDRRDLLLSAPRQPKTVQVDKPKTGMLEPWLEHSVICPKRILSGWRPFMVNRSSRANVAHAASSYAQATAKGELAGTQRRGLFSPILSPKLSQRQTDPEARK